LRTTPVRTPQQKELEKAEVEENTRRLIQNRQLDSMVDVFISSKEPEDRVTIKEFIKGQPRFDRIRLLDRFKRELQMGDLSNKGFWYDLASLPAIVRAKQFYAIWITKSPEEQKKFWSDARRVPRLVSRPFLREFRMIIAKEGAVP